MSPPEVWGPAVWTLFHTLIAKIDERAYPYISPQLCYMIVRICRFLPCPECSTDASNFLAKIKMSDMKTKRQFKDTFYLFHNRVNAKKRKRLYNYGNIDIYARNSLIGVVNNFIGKYQTKGNMKLIAESFQRQLVIADFRKWFIGSITAFIPKVAIPPRLPPPEPTHAVVVENIQLEIATEEHVVEKEEVAIVEQEVVIEEAVTQEEPIVIEVLLLKLLHRKKPLLKPLLLKKLLLNNKSH